jgi:acyl-CoA hydrolase
MGQARTVSHSKVIMTELVLPSHTNALDSVFGGIIMSWIDIAAAISSQRHSHLNVVTASIDALQFVAPVYKGWVVNLQASVNRAFRTSMEVGVRVDAENPVTGEFFHTATAYLTFVAVGENGKPVVVEPIVPESDIEKRRYQEAEFRRQHRLERKKALSKIK